MGLILLMCHTNLPLIVRLSLLFLRFSEKKWLNKKIIIKFIIVSNFGDIPFLVLKFLVIAYINNYIL